MSQQRTWQPQTANILLTTKGLKDLTISNTVVFPRINKTQGEAFTIHDMYLKHEYATDLIFNLVLKSEIHLLDMEE